MRTAGICILIAFVVQGAPIVRVPFVGCKSDGQTGPLPAPHGASKAVQLDAGTAQKVAYYSAEYPDGVLAPRGWYCFGRYGSGGSTLYVTPQPIKRDDLFSLTWRGSSGPAVQVGYTDGGTSGRFEVASVIARVFPAYRAFVRRIIKENEGLGRPDDFLFGPFPNDRLIYRATGSSSIKLLPIRRDWARGTSYKRATTLSTAWRSYKALHPTCCCSACDCRRA